MGSKLRQKVVIFLFWSGALIYVVTSCVSAGSSKLTENNMEKIINGKTTRNEIAEVLGEPEQILNLDREGLEKYLSRIGLINSSKHDFGEDQYEVWIYNRWSHATGLVLTPSYEEAKACIIIIDSQSVCVEKIYAKESSLGF
jgi:hypothetical protein